MDPPALRAARRSILAGVSMREARSEHDNPALRPEPATEPVGGPDALRHSQRRARRPRTDRRLARSREERLVGGVCAGVARFIGTTPALVRVLFTLTVPLSFGVTAFGYLFLWLLLPAEGQLEATR